MNGRFSIHLSPSVPDFMEQVLLQAATNPRCFVIDDGPRQKTVCFQWSAEAAERSSARYKQGHLLGYSVAMFSLTPDGIAPDPEVGNSETEPQLEEMVRWILRAFPNYRVIDDDTGEDVTDLVKADPEFLFLPDWMREQP